MIAILALTTYVPNYDRMLTMFLYMQIISIPDFFSLEINRYLKIFLFVFLISVYVLAFVSLFVIKNIGGTFPYNTIFWFVSSIIIYKKAVSNFLDESTSVIFL